VTVWDTPPGVVKLGTSPKGYHGVKPTVVLSDRELAGSQRGVKHFVPKRSGTSPEAHLSFFHNATYQMNDILRYKRKSSGVGTERCLILQVIGPMEALVGPQVLWCRLGNYSWDGHPFVSSQGSRDRSISWVGVNEKSGKLKLPTLVGYDRQLLWTEWGTNNPTKDWPPKLVVSEH
jgi:hypothetical protein